MISTYIRSEVILCIMSLIGVSLNIYVIKDMFYCKKVPIKAEIALIGIVTVSDLVVCFFTIVSQSIKISGVIRNTVGWCWSDLSIFSTSTFTTLTITSILSLVRYLSLVKRYNIPLGRCLLGSAVYLISVWIVIITRGSLNGLTIMPSGLYCMPRAKLETGYQWIFEILYIVLLLPCPFIILLCYISVAFRYQSLVKTSTNAAVQSTCSDLSNLSTIQAEIRGSISSYHWKRLGKLCLIIIMYTITFIPEYVLSSRELFFGIPRSAAQDTIAYFFMFLLSIINPIFVLDLRQIPSPVERSMELKQPVQSNS